MSLTRGVELELVDGCLLDEDVRAGLRPDAVMMDREGVGRRLPRYFYEVPSWQTARDLRLSDNFALWEFLNVDVRESEVMRRFPRYVPCAVTLLAAHLELFRREIGTVVHISANGGYRTPSHALTSQSSPHCWGTAVNIYKIGDQMLGERDQIEKYGELARKLLPGVWTRPYGHGVGETDDHLHIDLGFVTLVPHDAPGEDERREHVESSVGEEAG
ncbi:hypothetical protein BH23GEM6_BH23GEM6_03660 [soil metagenome]